MIVWSLIKLVTLNNLELFVPNIHWKYSLKYGLGYWGSEDDGRRAAWFYKTCVAAKDLCFSSGPCFKWPKFACFYIVNIKTVEWLNLIGQCSYFLWLHVATILGLKLFKVEPCNFLGYQENQNFEKCNVPAGIILIFCQDLM